MNRVSVFAVAVAMGAFVPVISAASSPEARIDGAYSDGTEVNGVPERAIILSGDASKIHDRVMTVLYDTNDLHFHDPGVPRFLFVDREGNTALGIGGYVEGVFSADFHGAIDDPAFITHSIPVPSSPTLRNRFGADVSRSTIFLKLVRNTGIGVLNAYVQTNFEGDNGGYGLKLKQAYVSLGDVMAGLARSTFVDAAAGAPTIDYQGPSGEVGGENVLLRYRHEFASDWAVAVGVEMPEATYTTVAGESEKINQRVPDIPAYIQYGWHGGASHIRLSAIFRELSYRDVLDGSNCFATGYGVQLSGVSDFYDIVGLYYQATCGKGLGRYVNDLSGFGYDLIPSATAGKMKAPASFSFAAGLRFNLRDNFFVSGSYSLSRLYDQEVMPADTYRRGNYFVVNAFYTPISDLQIGVEYLHGSRRDMNGESDSANRLQAMVKYSF